MAGGFQLQPISRIPISRLMNTWFLKPAAIVRTKANFPSAVETQQFYH